MAEDLEARFLRLIRARSREHEMVMDFAVENALWAAAGGILRQELDSLIRVHYLSTLSAAARTLVLNALMTTGQFGTPNPNSPGEVSRVSDRKMVDLMPPSHGWARRLYDIGNRFVHLTDAHGYEELDPFQALPLDVRGDIVDHLNGEHRIPGRLATVVSSFEEIMGYSPRILAKIRSNLPAT